MGEYGLCKCANPMEDKGLFCVPIKINLMYDSCLPLFAIQLSHTDAPEALLKRCGWDVPTVNFIGDETAHYDRWPF